MADTGKIATGGFGAGAIKYVVLDGFVPSPATLVNACIVTMGFGAANTHKIALDGFVANPPASGAFWVFGDAVIE